MPGFRQITARNATEFREEAVRSKKEKKSLERADAFDLRSRNGVMREREEGAGI